MAHYKKLIFNIFGGVFNFAIVVMLMVAVLHIYFNKIGSTFDNASNIFDCQEHQSLQNSKIIIQSGAGSANIGVLLAKHNVLPNKTAFFILVSVLRLSKKLPQGEFLLKLIKGRDILHTIRNLYCAKSIVYKINFPEGMCIKEIINKINNISFLQGDKIALNRLEEGHLFPSTYFFNRFSTKQALFAQMQNNMTKMLNKYWLLGCVKLKKYGLKNSEQLLKLASIVEKEAANFEEKRNIAGIYLNRLKKRAFLSSCPSVIYGLRVAGLLKDRKCLSISRQDMRIITPHNTYRKRGLPITAICCPGESSFQAVVNFQLTDNLFFVLNKQTGKHIFTKTLKNHNNIKIALKKNKATL